MQNVFFTIYKITNQINEKIYIGKHQTFTLDDGYMGSGKYLRNAIDKYGIENFKKEILFVFDNEQDMNAKEKELVTEEFVDRRDTYNLCPGGLGGFGYINRNGMQGSFTGLKHSRLTKEKISKIKKGIPKSTEHKKKISDAHKGKQAGQKNPMFGKTHSDKTKQKMSLAQTGQQNSQFGTMWITNGTENKKIKKVDNIPEGWYKGRTIKN